MLQETLSKAKFALLKRKLGGHYKAIGVLQGLWLFARANAPRGDVGRKYSDEEIESLLEWDGPPGSMIAALISTRWLDQVDGPERLVVHEWSTWADEATHAKLARGQQFFADGATPKLWVLPEKARKKAEAWYAEHPYGPREAIAKASCRPREDVTGEGEGTGEGTGTDTGKKEETRAAAREPAGTGSLLPDPDPAELEEPVGPNHPLLHLISKRPGSPEEKRLWLQDNIAQLKIVAAAEGKPIRELVIRWFKVYVDKPDRKWREVAERAGARAEAAALRQRLGSGVEQEAGDSR